MVAFLISSTILLSWLGGVFVWLAGNQRPRAQHCLAVFFSIAAGLAALAALPVASDHPVVNIPLGSFFGNFTLVPDGLGMFLAVVATVVGSLAVIFSVDYMRGEKDLGRYYSLVLYFIGAMCGLALTGSFLFLFFFWEITAFSSYALISFYNDDPKAVAGGVKALLITQVGGVGLLAGALVAYAQTGDYSIATFLSHAPELPQGLLAIMAFGFLIAAAAKSAQVPFQTWLPDAMEAPTPVSALIHAATMVNAGVYLLARFYPAFAPVPGWTTAVILVGSVTALLAAVMAVVSNDLKRILAYSTVSQLGYMVYAVGVGNIYAAGFHLLSHAIFKAMLFLAAGAVIHALGTRDILKMGGIGRRMPFTGAAFLIGALALAGIPPVNGFWSKEFILEGGLAHGPGWAYGIMLLGAGLTALYTLRVFWLVFMGEPRSQRSAHKAGSFMRVSLALLAAGTLVSWVLAGPFGRLLTATLPFHEVHAPTTLELVVEVLSAPATWLALGVVTLGLAAWWLRENLAGLKTGLGWLATVAEQDFGFNRLNSRIVSGVQHAGAEMQKTQTGYLNWNIVGVLGGLIFVMVLLLWGA